MKEKEALGNAVHHLLHKKNLEDITIKEILEKAAVTRYQFEKNFGTKEALAEWEYVQLLSGIADDILGSSCWSEALFKKFTFYEKHLGFFRHIYASKDMDHLRLSNQRFVRDAYEFMLKKQGADISDPHIAFALDFAVYGGEEMTMQWVIGGMKMPKEVMLVLFQESVPKCIMQYFK